MSRGFLSYGAPIRKESWMHDSAVVKSRTLFIYMVYIVCECCRYSLIRPEKVPSAVALDAESNEVVQRSFTYAKKQVGVCSSQIPMFWSSISRFLLQASAILRPGEAISGFNRLQNLRQVDFLSFRSDDVSKGEQTKIATWFMPCSSVRWKQSSGAFSWCSLQTFGDGESQSLGILNAVVT